MIAEKFFADQNFSFKDGVFFQKGFVHSGFEDAYIDVRKKEGRFFTENEIAKLPDLKRNHPHFTEWQIRSNSTQRLVQYISKGNGTKNILEIGCGNGWLSNRLSKINDSQIIALDVNVIELKQAYTVFNSIKNIAFVAADVFTLDLPVKMDYIVLASSAQYFSDLNLLLTSLLQKLSDDGEIHILDTPFYHHHQVSQAKERSQLYFQAHNSKMIDHYYHHTFETLSEFNFEILYNPATPISRLKIKFLTASPFPWIKIKNNV
jgi:ubiquinone/menaquinone biosynthesis C-methylase UbiE